MNKLERQQYEELQEEFSDYIRLLKSLVVVLRNNDTPETVISGKSLAEWMEEYAQRLSAILQQFYILYSLQQAANDVERANLIKQFSIKNKFDLAKNIPEMRMFLEKNIHFLIDPDNLKVFKVAITKIADMVQSEGILIGFNPINLHLPEEEKVRVSQDGALQETISDIQLYESMLNSDIKNPDTLIMLNKMAEKFFQRFKDALKDYDPSLSESYDSILNVSLQVYTLLSDRLQFLTQQNTIMYLQDMTDIKILEQKERKELDKILEKMEEFAIKKGLISFDKYFLLPFSDLTKQPFQKTQVDAVAIEALLQMLEAVPEIVTPMLSLTQQPPLLRAGYSVSYATSRSDSSLENRDSQHPGSEEDKKAAVPASKPTIAEPSESESPNPKRPRPSLSV